MARNEEITTKVEEKIDQITGEILKTTSETKRVIAFSGRENDKDKDYLKTWLTMLNNIHADMVSTEMESQKGKIVKIELQNITDNTINTLKGIVK